MTEVAGQVEVLSHLSLRIQAIAAPLPLAGTVCNILACASLYCGGARASERHNLSVDLGLGQTAFAL